MAVIHRGSVGSAHEEKNSYGDDYKVSEKSRKVSNGHPLDLLVAHISKTLNDLKNKVEKNNQRVLGLETQFMDSLYKNEDLQKSISELMKVPGAKKSVIAGMPYIFEKDGTKLPLVKIQREPQDFQKSSGKRDFKDFWKSEKSTIYDNQ